jgi:beta-1,4-mannosyltransferase
VSAEHDVSFDNGPDGSVAEDCFFILKALSKGYRCDWIEGEMHESSSFSILDHIKQRKRWFQGTFLTARSNAIPLKNKIFLIINVFAVLTTPLTVLNFFFAFFYPISCATIEIIGAVVGGITIYFQIFGTFKSLSFHRYGFLEVSLAVIGSICTIPLKIVVENTAVIWGLLTNKHQFYVINKKLPCEREDVDSKC